MTATIEEKVERLRQINEEKYTKRGLLNPKEASVFAVTDILNMYRGQGKYLSMLLDGEIEDALTALAAIQ